MLLVIILLPIVALLYMLFRKAKIEAKLRESLHFNEGGSPRLRISVVVTRPQSVSYIASLLNSESTSYQVVVVADFSDKEQLLKEMVEYFGLFKTSYASNEELPQGAIRSLLRSYRRLFSRVVVVDSPHDGRYTPFEVGAVISSYNYNLQIDSSKGLRPRAIENLLLELATRPEGSVELITSAVGERVKLICREAALPKGVDKIEIKPSRHRKINYKLLQSL